MVAAGTRRIGGGREGDGVIVVVGVVIEGEGEAEAAMVGDGKLLMCGFRCWDLTRIALALRRDSQLTNLEPINRSISL